MPGGKEMAVSELVVIAAGIPQDAKDREVHMLGAKEANRKLKLYGLKVIPEGNASLAAGHLLMERGNKEIEKMLEETSFRTGWEDQILGVKGAARHVGLDSKPKKERFAGNPSGAISIKLSAVLVDDAEETPPTPTSGPYPDPDDWNYQHDDDMPLSHRGLPLPGRERRNGCSAHGKPVADGYTLATRLATSISIYISIY